jgi:DNA-binding MltR family transcriptional regulator
MARSRGKKSDNFSTLRKRLQERLASDDIMLTLLGYEGDPKEGHTFNDRAVALTVTALLEQFLEAAISTHLEINEDEVRQLFDDDRDGPLSTFSRKIAMGYALGVYDSSMKSVLNLIRQIRNAFAHAKVHLDFDTPEIRAIVNHINLGNSSQFRSMSGNRSTSPRKIFVSCIRLLCAYFNDEQRPMKYNGIGFYSALYDLSP